jgi:hypothetical protein
MIRSFIVIALIYKRLRVAASRVFGWHSGYINYAPCENWVSSAVQANESGHENDFVPKRFLYCREAYVYRGRGRIPMS